VYRKSNIQSGIVWQLTISNPLYSESPLKEHAFITNPLAFTAHKNQLLDTQEAYTKAYTLRATKESYLIIIYQLNTHKLAISRKKYYNLYRGLSSLPPKNSGQNYTLGTLKLLL
jgi:hypothetical protein